MVSTKIALRKENPPLLTKNNKQSRKHDLASDPQRDVEEPSHKNDEERTNKQSRKHDLASDPQRDVDFFTSPIRNSKIEQEPPELSKDIYSLVYSSTGNDDSCQVLCFVVFIFAIQVTLLMATFVDLSQSYRKGENISWPNAPAGVDWQVFICQYISIFLVVSLQEDVIEAIWSGLFFISSSSSKLLWYLSRLMKFSVGFLTLFLSLDIVISSNKVIDLLANFAALYVVNKIDNAGFTLARMGFFTNFLQNKANACIREGFISVDQDRTSNCLIYLRRIILAVITSAMLLMLGWVHYQQKQGGFFSSSLDLVLGGEVESRYSQVSSEYIWDGGKRYNGRPVYIEKRCRSRCEDKYCCFSFHYCLNLQQWVGRFSPDNLDLDANDFHPCRQKVKEAGNRDKTTLEIRSAETDSYDIMSPEKWSYFSIEKNMFLHLESFTFFDNECDYDGVCSDRGTCNKKEKRCECDIGYFGTRCESMLPCESLHLDLNTHTLGGCSTFYKLLHYEDDAIVTINNGRPIYYNENDFPGSYNLIMYDGIRWFVRRGDFPNTSIMANYFGRDFHTGDEYENEFKIAFLSQQNYGHSPEGLKWRKYDARYDDEYDRLEEVNTFLFCPDCNSDYSCGNGICSDETRTCLCEIGYHGVNCERKSVEIEYSVLFDGGAEDTCMKCSNSYSFNTPTNGTSLPFCWPLNFQVDSSCNSWMIAVGMNIENFALEIFVTNNNSPKDDDLNSICSNDNKIDEIRNDQLNGLSVHYEDVFVINTTSLTPPYATLGNKLEDVCEVIMSPCDMGERGKEFSAMCNSGHFTTDKCRGGNIYIDFKADVIFPTSLIYDFPSDSYYECYNPVIVDGDCKYDDGYFDGVCANRGQQNQSYCSYTPGGHVCTYCKDGWDA